MALVMTRGGVERCLSSLSRRFRPSSSPYSALILLMGLVTLLSSETRITPRCKRAYIRATGFRVLGFSVGDWLRLGLGQG
eukprot:7746946-Pyramimonas_sp.AAC.1